MNITSLRHDFLALVSGHPLLERLFFASLEFVALAGLVWVAIRVVRLKSARLIALLWLVVLAKPVVSLAVGSPLHVLTLQVVKPAPEEAAPEPVAVAPEIEPVANPAPVVADAGPAALPPGAFPFEFRPDERFALPMTPPAEPTAVPNPVAESASETTDLPADLAAKPDSLRWSAATIAISVWLAGVAFLVCRSVLDRLRLRRLIRRASVPNAELAARYARLVSATAARRAPWLRITDELESPALIGSVFPTVLVPQWLASKGAAETLDWALRHELMHWKMLDPLASLVREVAQVLFYFHPAAWWAGRQWEVAAELACDRALVTSEADSRDYAERLYGMLEEIRGRRRIPVKTGLFATRTQIVQRIAALVRGPHATRAHLSALAIVAVAAVSAAALSVGGTFADKSTTADDAIASAESPDEATDSAIAFADAESAKGAASASATEPTARDRDSDRAPAVPEQDGTLTFAGTVVGPDGKPVEGAKLSLSYLRLDDAPDPPPAGAMSDPSGRFEFSVKKNSIAAAISRWTWDRVGVVAAKDGYGFDYLPATHLDASGRIDAELGPRQREELERTAGKKRTVLQLVADDVPVRGRVVDIEGRPVVGAKIDVVAVLVGNAGSLDAWETATAQEQVDFGVALRHSHVLVAGYAIGADGFQRSGGGDDFPGGRWYGDSVLLGGWRAPIVSAVRTDREGRFGLKGLGRDRIAEFVVSAPGVETTQRFLRSRAGKVIELPANGGREYGVETFYPNEFTVVAGPTAPVSGRVIDKATARPVPGVHVRSMYQLFGHAVSDADGRYRLDGLRLGGSELWVMPPRGTRHLAGQVTVKTKTASQPVSRDIVLTEGLLVRGRAVDDRTGKPTPGTAWYFAYKDNPFLKETDSLGSSNHQIAFVSDAEGRFEIPVLPGKGIVGYFAGDAFLYGLGAETVDCPGPDPNSKRGLFDTLPQWCIADRMNRVVPIDLRPDDKGLIVDVALRATRDIPGRVLSPMGQPLSNYSVNGARLHVQWQRNAGEAFTVKSYDPSEGRRLMVYHAETELGGYRVLTGEPPAEVEMKLTPSATLVGRIIGADGVPLANVQIDATARERGERGPLRRIGGALPGHEHGDAPQTDETGRFTIHGIIPGLRYTGHLFTPEVVPGVSTIFIDVTVQPGETKDLGDLQPKPMQMDTADEPADAAATNTTAAAERSTVASKNGAAAAADHDVTFTFAGTVVGPDRKPVEGAKVSLSYLRLDDAPEPPAARSMSDASGRFEFSVKRSHIAQAISKWTWNHVGVVAMKDGYGFDYLPAGYLDTSGQFETGLTEYERKWIDEKAGKRRNVLQLVADDVPVRGRVVDLEGRPVPGANVQIVGVLAGRDGSLDAWEAAVAQDDAEYIKMWKNVRPLAEGYYEAGRFLRFAGGNGYLSRRSYQPFKFFYGLRAPIISAARSDADGRFTVKGLGRDRIAEFVVSAPGIETTERFFRSRPGKVIELPMSRHDNSGVETFYPNDFTVVAGPGAVMAGRVLDKVTAKPVSGAVVHSTSQLLVRAEADPQGNYRLEGLPPEGNLLLVTPPAQSRYLAGGLRAGLSAQQPLARDIVLTEGVLVRGRAVDERTGDPVRGSVTYYAYETNPDLQGSDSLQQPGFSREFRAQLDADGRFELPVLPGQGILAFDAGDEFERGLGIDTIDCPRSSDANASYVEFLTAPLRCYASRYSLVMEVNPKSGEKELTVTATLRSVPDIPGRVLSPDGKILSDYIVQGTRGRGWNNEGETFTIKGYVPTEIRWLLAYHPGLDLAGYYVLTGKPPEIVEIKLGPAATLVGRVFDAEGLPLEIPQIDGDATAPGVPESRDGGIQVFRLDGSPGLPHSDASGRFKLRGIIPGLKYTGTAVLPRKRPTGRFVLFSDVIVEPGETKELGDVRPVPLKRYMAADSGGSNGWQGCY